MGCHFHDTRNTGPANTVESGATVLAASVGGTGGCPFAFKASGSVVTEDPIYLLHGTGYPTGVNLEALIGCPAWLAALPGKELPASSTRPDPFPVAGKTLLTL